MDWIQRINSIVTYIEDNLDGEISNERIAQLAGCSIYNFQRMFSYIANRPLADYIRSRRLTKAALELLSGSDRILDVALKYGYESHDAFTRAFQRFHGVLPSKLRTETVKLKSCPPITFHFTIQGGTEMNYQLEQWPAFTVTGWKHPVKSDEAFQVVPALWDKAQQDGTIGSLIGLWKLADNRPSGLLGLAVGGNWGSAELVDYYMGVTTYVDAPDSKRIDTPVNMTSVEVPAATWIIVEAEGSLPDSVQNVYKEFYGQWLPNSGYQLADVPVIECYFPEHQEVWIAVIPQAK